MHRSIPSLSFLFFASFSLLSCGVDQASQQEASFAKMEVPDYFADYWYAGEAELNSYSLDIIRYGEKRRGQAINVFVSEDFSATEQVKIDYPQDAGADKVSILKLNQIYKFETGIYDYSLMSSIFTPIEIRQYPHTLKTTCTVQDWCGQTFTQLNREEDRYRLQQFSYFQSEGDEDKNIRPEMLEDELWTRLRIDPASIPEGEVLMYPGNFFQRLSHEELEPRAARIQFASSEATRECIVEYLHLDRTLKIRFESNFPHRILSWTVVKGNQEMVNATLRETIKSPYWQQNGNKYSYLRDSLKLN